MVEYAARSSNGSAVPNARVSLTDERTGTVRFSTTSNDGGYVFNQVIPSAYSVSVESTGFKKSQQKNVTVATQEQLIVDLTLSQGSLTGIGQSVSIFSPTAQSPRHIPRTTPGRGSERIQHASVQRPEYFR